MTEQPQATIADAIRNLLDALDRDYSLDRVVSIHIDYRSVTVACLGPPGTVHAKDELRITKHPWSPDD